MEKWEYRTEFVFANIENKSIMNYFKEKYPNWKNPSKFAPETMELYLNQQGEEGWEVISLEPVRIGKNSDVFFTGSYEGYSNVYFCAMKRRKSE